ncbi:LysR family transcriptional regulator ArgP [Granulosicoccus sp. 3-233]|uniref:LysR family transcriptional regulator ArgP n=1 Tax=Granulosicoccus sp. 3-233 TaxID=3417969 RepID=UPI003D33FC4B
MLDYDALATLTAVLQTGSFEQAARRLHVTPSAVSQRVRQLEQRLGAPLVIRAQPCHATAVGERLLRHTQDVALLESRLATTMPDIVPAGVSPTLRIAVNADTLSTWFIDALASCSGLLFELILDDQDHSQQWLERGEVVAAVTADAAAVSGCDVLPLGSLRYCATASPAFVERHFSNGVDQGSLAAAPMLIFNNKDRLQELWMKQQGIAHSCPPAHGLPSSEAFVSAALAHMGWGMNPELLVRSELDSGRLVELIPESPLDIPLYWQSPRLMRDALAELTASVRQVAGEALLDKA